MGVCHRMFTLIFINGTVSQDVYPHFSLIYPQQGPLINKFQYFWIQFLFHQHLFEHHDCLHSWRCSAHREVWLRKSGLDMKNFRSNSNISTKSSTLTYNLFKPELRGEFRFMPKYKEGRNSRDTLPLKRTPLPPSLQLSWSRVIQYIQRYHTHTFRNPDDF